MGLDCLLAAGKQVLLEAIEQQSHIDLPRTLDPNKKYSWRQRKEEPVGNSRIVDTTPSKKAVSVTKAALSSRPFSSTARCRWTGWTPRRWSIASSWPSCRRPTRRSRGTWAGCRSGGTSGECVRQGSREEGSVPSGCHKPSRDSRLATCQRAAAAAAAGGREAEPD